MSNYSLFSINFSHYMSQKSICVVFLLCMAAWSPCWSQSSNWKIQHISTDKGLSNRFVNDITQDKRGYTWISTNFGLNRYDGSHFDVMTRESHHLSSNTMFDLLVDFRGNIWVIHRAAVH